MADITERYQTNQVIGLQHQGVAQATGQKVGIYQLLQRDVGRHGRRFGIHDLTHGHATQDGCQHALRVCRLGGA